LPELIQDFDARHPPNSFFLLYNRAQIRENMHLYAIEAARRAPRWMTRPDRNNNNRRV
jgi:hypothetical protein